MPPLVLYLATDEAANINGRVFVVAGRYVGLFQEPEEVFLLYRDHEKDGPWTIEELAGLLPPKLALDLVNPAAGFPEDKVD